MTKAATKARGTTHAKTSAPRQRARRGEGEKLREEILDATEALLLETGNADKVSTRAVARRVGCSSPSLYLHFPDKNALMFAVCERQFNKLGAVIEAEVAGIADPLERLQASAQAYARFALEHPEQYRVMMLDLEYSKFYEASLEELSDSSGFNVVRAAVQEAMDLGEMIDGDATLVTLALWAAVHGMVSLMIVKRGIGLPPVEELIDLVCHQNMDGFRPR